MLFSFSDLKFLKFANNRFSNSSIMTNRRLYFSPNSLESLKSPHIIASYANVIMATVVPEVASYMCPDISGKGFPSLILLLGINRINVSTRKYCRVLFETWQTRFGVGVVGWRHKRLGISLSFNVVLLFLFNAFYVYLQYLSRNFSDGLNKYFGNKRDSLRIHKKETNTQLQTLSLRYLEKAYIRNWKWSVQNIFSLVQFPNQISIPCITGKHYITSLTDYSQVWYVFLCALQQWTETYMYCTTCVMVEKSVCCTPPPQLSIHSNISTSTTPTIQATNFQYCILWSPYLHLRQSSKLTRITVCFFPRCFKIFQWVDYPNIVT